MLLRLCFELILSTSLILLIGADRWYEARTYDHPQLRNNAQQRNGYDQLDSSFQYTEHRNVKISFDRSRAMNSAPPRSCYSCMSIKLKNNWNVLGGIYRMPANFTDRCISGKELVGTIECDANAPCVTMIEPDYMGGEQVFPNIK